jgi:hypothetical protein
MAMGCNWNVTGEKKRGLFRKFIAEMEKTGFW